MTQTRAGATGDPLRILLYNVGYATGLRGSMWEYLIRFYRYLWTPRHVIRQVRHAVHALLTTVKPDVCCFVEIHRGRGFLSPPRFYGFGDTDVKYGLHSVLRWLPFFRNNCNGFLSKKHYPFRKLYFENGTKKLIYEIRLRPDLWLVFAHFSLERSVRALQCREIAALIRDRGGRVILCGDFNIFSGRSELKSLARACDLQIVNAPRAPTFPTAHPTLTLDLFLCPHDLTNARATVLDGIQASDHLPVLLELSA